MNVPERWILGQTVLTLFVLASGPLDGDWSNASLGARIAAGILLVVGAWLGIAGVVDLGKNRTVSPVPKADGNLVTTGVYRRVRHPLYGSLIALGAAWSLAWATWIGALVTVALWRLLFGKSTFEETLLESRFPDYGAYRETTPRFFPFGGVRVDPSGRGD